ncbi:hypothetical protein D3C80_1645710 [compost metagenome]
MNSPVTSAKESDLRRFAYECRTRLKASSESLLLTKAPSLVQAIRIRSSANASTAAIACIATECFSVNSFTSTPSRLMRAALSPRIHMPCPRPRNSSSTRSHCLPVQAAKAILFLCISPYTSSNRAASKVPLSFKKVPSISVTTSFSISIPP